MKGNSLHNLYMLHYKASTIIINISQYLFFSITSYSGQYYINPNEDYNS